MGGLADRIRYALANALRDDHTIDPMRELADLPREAGLEPESGGGAVTFAGRDPIVSSPLPFATMAAVALMAKAVSLAELWRFRGGQSQDLAVNLGKALHRLCPFYDNKWELLNGYALGNPPDPIVFDRDGLHVLVVENGIAHSRKITEIRDLETEVEVSDGVKQGDQVVLTPPVDLEDGSKVQVRATPMAKSS